MEKIIHKIQQTFMIETVNKSGIWGNVFHLINGNYKKNLHLKITLNCERLNAFPCKITDKTKMTTSIQHRTGDSSQDN